MYLFSVKIEAKQGVEFFALLCCLLFSSPSLLKMDLYFLLFSFIFWSIYRPFSCCLFCPLLVVSHSVPPSFWSLCYTPLLYLDSHPESCALVSIFWTVLFYYCYFRPLKSSWHNHASLLPSFLSFFHLKVVCCCAYNTVAFSKCQLFCTPLSLSLSSSGRERWKRRPCVHYKALVSWGLKRSLL